MGDDYKTFSADLAAQTGALVPSRDNLRPQTTRIGRTVVLSIPAKSLTPGQYELSLNGTTAEGQSEVVGYYYFDVVKK